MVVTEITPLGWIVRLVSYTTYERGNEAMHEGDKLQGLYI